MQPVADRVYVMVVVPSEMPVTTPEDEIVPTAGVLLLHTPPDDVVPRLVVEPGHTVRKPLIASGIGLTETIFVAVREQPELLVTVNVTGNVPEAV